MMDINRPILPTALDHLTRTLMSFLVVGNIWRNIRGAQKGSSLYLLISFRGHIACILGMQHLFLALDSLACTWALPYHTYIFGGTGGQAAITPFAKTSILFFVQLDLSSHSHDAS